MRYETLRVSREGSALASAARRGADTLRAGGIAVHPTSTLYGLGARADPELDAVLARLKGRPPGKPLVRLVPDLETVRTAVGPGGWDERAERLARRFWPGPLTLVLDDGSEQGIAARVDPHPVALALLDELRRPMSSTSVNRAGEPPAHGPEEVRATLQRMPETERPVIFLDAGPLPPGQEPSTILSLRGPLARLLREGAVPASEIEACLGDEVER